MSTTGQMGNYEDVAQSLEVGPCLCLIVELSRRSNLSDNIPSHNIDP